MTHFPIIEIVSVDLVSTDLDAHETFYRDVWGLTPVAHQSDTRFLRGTGRNPYLLALLPGDVPGFAAVTFRCASLEDMEQIAERAENYGCERSAGPEAGSRPGKGQMIDLREPNGCTIRLIYGDEIRLADPLQRDRAERLAHVNINTKNVDGLADFYADVLGFQLTDRSKLMAFLRCNSDHHAVVIAEAPTEGLNHVAFLLPELEGVMMASGRMRDHGFRMGWGVGRHGPGDNVFAYFVDPEGYVVEHTAEVLQVDDTYQVKYPDEWTWPPGRTDQWGLAAPKSADCKAAQLAIGFV